MRGSEFNFDLSHYNLHKINLRKVGSYIDFPEWLKNKKAPISSENNRKDWKKFELSNKSIALHILYVPHNTKKIRHTCKSKYKLKGEN